jgi:hypothetical protein
MSDNSGESEEKKTIHVVDRRRFEADGAERRDEPSAERNERPSASPKDNSHRTPDPDTNQARPNAPQGEGDVSFMSFVMSLATQALVQLGEMAPPPGMEIPVDRVAAQQTIDILTMLQRKTVGNLSADEARFIEEVLHSLRMSYVRSAR